MPTSLTPSTHYEQVIIAFGGKGYIAETRQQVREAFLTCLADGQSTSLINIIISPTATKKPQVNCLMQLLESYLSRELFIVIKSLMVYISSVIL